MITPAVATLFAIILVLIIILIGALILVAKLNRTASRKTEQLNVAYENLITLISENSETHGRTFTQLVRIASQAGGVSQVFALEKARLRRRGRIEMGETPSLTKD